MIASRWAGLAGALSIAAAGGIIVGPAAAAPLNGYIVVLEPSSTAVGSAASDLAARVGARVDGVFEHAVEGFVVHAAPASAARLAADPRVAFVELDRPVTLDAVSTPTGVQRIRAASNPLLRIDGADDVRVDADVAVIDTGIDLQHPDLVIGGSVNCTAAGPIAGCAAGGDDDHFHGTHVAGIIGAKDNGDAIVGVAPGVRLWSVKVLDSTGNGLVSNVIRGIDWVAANAATIEVANLSLGVPGYDAALDLAIQRAVNAGVAFAVAAGNSSVDAGSYSPAMFPTVLTVSALADFDGLAGGIGAATCLSDVDDTLADFSNAGPVVDLVAPGVCIHSTVPVERGGDGVLSGTSMASPHVAGALALLARATNPATAADVATMYATLVAAGRRDWTDDSGDGVQEPRLDVGALTRFQAAAVPACPLDPTEVIEWWKADGSTAASIGEPLAGPAGYAPSSVGGSAFSFDGRTMLSDPDTLPTTSGLTVQGWFRVAASDKGGTLVSRWDHLGPEGGTGSRAYLLSLDPVGQTLVFTTDETTRRVGEEVRVSVPTLFDRTFHHIAATWDQHSITLYVDGEPVATEPSQGGLLNPATTVPLRVGGASGKGNPIHFLGDADEISIWYRALTPLEVAQSYLADASALCV